MLGVKPLKPLRLVPSGKTGYAHPRSGSGGILGLGPSWQFCGCCRAYCSFDSGVKVCLKVVLGREQAR